MGADLHLGGVRPVPYSRRAKLKTLRERYGTDYIIETNLPTARCDKYTQSHKITPEHRTIINDNDNVQVTALWRYAGERNAKFLGRQGGAAAD